MLKEVNDGGKNKAIGEEQKRRVKKDRAQTEDTMLMIWR